MSLVVLTKHGLRRICHISWLEAGRGHASRGLSSNASCHCRELLGLPTEGAKLLERDVRHGYRAAARRLHPDRGGQQAEFQELQRCYETLLAEAKGECSGTGSKEWLKQMKKDFANFSCC
eukprot:TRINITY_DN101379_c0_g1_i1.p1 TRINITY_DN101379_c0_g1~~TRINITY_DN101379_c0_g1_i1.p1  ORF type:complete len:120 (+),score=22.90 TRINITY_DN101379_c0_g1_i1:37-396(+)